MFEPTVIDFKLDGVQGDLRLSYDFIGAPKLFQNGQPLKKKGFFRAKYDVHTDDLMQPVQEVEVKRGLTFTYAAVFRGKETVLEKPLSVLELVLGLAPLILLIFLGGFLGALFGIISTQFIFNFMRSEDRMPLKILIAALVSIITYALYFGVAFALGLIFYGLHG